MKSLLSSRLGAGISLVLLGAVILGLSQVWIGALNMKRSLDLALLCKELRLVLDNRYLEKGQYPDSLTNLMLPSEVGVYRPSEDVIVAPNGGLLRYTKVSSNSVIISAEFKAKLLLSSASNAWTIHFGLEAQEGAREGKEDVAPP